MFLRELSGNLLSLMIKTSVHIVCNRNIDVTKYLRLSDHLIPGGAMVFCEKKDCSANF